MFYGPVKFSAAWSKIYRSGSEGIYTILVLIIYQLFPTENKENTVFNHALFFIGLAEYHYLVDNYYNMVQIY